jgi:hypothetical protein
MPWMAPAAIGGAAAIGGFGASKAGKASADASKEAIEASKQANMYSRQDLQPWLNSGENALNAYNQALGLGGAYENELMTWNEFANSPLAPNKHKSKAYTNYVNTFDQGQWIPDGNGPTGMDPFSFNLENDDIYQFAQDEGLRGAQRRMAQTGHGNSGNVFAELQNRSSGIASQYQNDAFNRQLGGYQQNYGQEQNYLNRLSGLSGGGQNAANTLAGYGGQSAANQGNIYMQDAANQGNMYQGMNNALQGGIGNYLTYDYLNNNPSPYSGSGPAYGNWGDGGFGGGR